MNKAILIGRLTKDPELRYTQSGAATCSFTLAIDRPFTNQSGEKEADFINIVVWNKPAENVAKYLAKGRQAAVEGRIQIRRYTDKEGTKRYATEVVASSVEFLGGKPEAAQPARNTGSYGQEVSFDDAEMDDMFDHSGYEQQVMY